MENNKSKSGPPSEKTAMEDLFGYMNPITILQFVSATQDEERVSIVYNALSHLQLFDPTALQRAKSAVDAARHRHMGSAECTRPKPNLPEALSWFTKCIAAADPHSADLALDFASRSAVLYKMAKYEECLSDVDQAGKMGYPDQLRYQLHLRRGDCLHIMGRTEEAKTSFEEAVRALPLAVDLPPSEQKRQLCYARVQLARIDKGYAREEGYRGRRERPPPRLADGVNPAVPAMARCVEICSSEQWGRHVRATRHIRPGEVLIVEDPYVSILWSTNYKTHCYHCLRRFDALIPCKTCPLVMFCSEECRETSWTTSHASECPLLFLLNQVPRYHFLLTPLRVILVAVNHYRGLRGLHDHVKRMEAKESQGTNHVERSETTIGGRATEETDNVARMKVANSSCTEEGTDGSRQIGNTNNVQPTKATDACRQTEATNGVRPTKSKKNRKRTMANNVRTTGEVNDASSQTNAIFASSQPEATNTSRQTEATNTSIQTEATNASRQTEATNASRQTEATNTSRQKEATNASRQTEATNDVTRIAGFNTEGRYLSSDYTAVHHMLTNSRQLTVHKLWPYALNAALLVKCLECWGELRTDLESGELKRFLGGLLLRYEMIVASNGYPVDEYSPVADPALPAKSCGVGGGVYPTAGLLNHACDANTCGYQRGDRVVVTATQPIAKGEQVFIDYVGQRLSIHAPPSTRRSYLEEQFHFTCHCPLCTHGLPTADLADLLLSWQCNRCHARLQGGGGSRGPQHVAVTCHRCKERTTTERLRGEAEERVARFKGLARRARGSGDVTEELGEVLTEMCGGGERAAPQLVFVFKSMLRMNCTQAGKYFLED